MDAKFYKNLKTSRGMLYSYYQRAPTADVLSSLDPNDPPLPALLFLHGFPTSSRLWKRQISFFLERGFVVCAPDLLGFGNTSKPTETGAYRSSLICKDIVEILDAEDMDRVIAIGHDLLSIPLTIFVTF
jgi:soluble epoxide hydrolase/lipid-phosphate phosphatase